MSSKKGVLLAKLVKKLRMQYVSIWKGTRKNNEVLSLTVMRYRCKYSLVVCCIAV